MPVSSSDSVFHCPSSFSSRWVALREDDCLDMRWTPGWAKSVWDDKFECSANVEMPVFYE